MQEHTRTRARAGGTAQSRATRRQRKLAESAAERGKLTVAEVERAATGADALNRACSGLLSVLVAIEARDAADAEHFRWDLARQIAAIAADIATRRAE